MGTAKQTTPTRPAIHQGIERTRLPTPLTRYEVPSDGTNSDPAGVGNAAYGSNTRGALSGQPATYDAANTNDGFDIDEMQGFPDDATNEGQSTKFERSKTGVFKSFANRHKEQFKTMLQRKRKNKPLPPNERYVVGDFRCSEVEITVPNACRRVAVVFPSPPATGTKPAPPIVTCLGIPQSNVDTSQYAGWPTEIGGGEDGGTAIMLSIDQFSAILMTENQKVSQEDKESNAEQHKQMDEIRSHQLDKYPPRLLPVNIQKTRKKGSSTTVERPHFPVKLIGKKRIKIDSQPTQARINKLAEVHVAAMVADLEKEEVEREKEETAKNRRDVYDAVEDQPTGTASGSGSVGRSSSMPPSHQSNDARLADQGLSDHMKMDLTNIYWRDSLNSQDTNKEDMEQKIQLSDMMVTVPKQQNGSDAPGDSHDGNTVRHPWFYTLVTHTPSLGAIVCHGNDSTRVGLASLKPHNPKPMYILAVCAKVYEWPAERAHCWFFLCAKNDAEEVFGTLQHLLQKQIKWRKGSNGGFFWRNPTDAHSGDSATASKSSEGEKDAVTDNDRNQLTWVRALGAGHFGDVHLVQTKDSSGVTTQYAAKMCKHSEAVMAVEQRYYASDGIGEEIRAKVRDYLKREKCKDAPLNKVWEELEVSQQKRVRDFDPSARTGRLEQKKPPHQQPERKDLFRVIVDDPLMNFWYDQVKDVVFIIMLENDNLKKAREFYYRAKEFEKEARIMKELSNKNVCGRYGHLTVFKPELLLLEYTAYGDLRTLVKKMKAASIRKPNKKGKPTGPVIQKKTFQRFEAQYLALALQILDGMVYLEEEKIVHMDVSLRNMLVGESSPKKGTTLVKVADFGRAWKCDGRPKRLPEEFYSLELPVFWMANEVLLREPVSHRSDIFSFGVTCWELVSGGDDSSDLDRAVMEANLSSQTRPPTMHPYQTYVHCRKDWLDNQIADNSANPESNKILLALAKEYCWDATAEKRAASFISLRSHLLKKVSKFNKKLNKRHAQSVRPAQLGDGARIEPINNIGAFAKKHLKSGKDKSLEETDLHRAARDGDVKKIMRLREENKLEFDQDDEDQDRVRPIHYAARAGQHLAFEYLLSINAQLALKDRHERGILHHIALAGPGLEYGHLEIIRTLIARAAGQLFGLPRLDKETVWLIFNSPDRQGRTPIHYLIHRPGHEDSDWDANAGLASTVLETIFDAGLATSNFFNVKPGDAKFNDYNLINQKDGDRRSCLFLVILHGYINKFHIIHSLSLEQGDALHETVYDAVITSSQDRRQAYALDTQHVLGPEDEDAYDAQDDAQEFFAYDDVEYAPLGTLRNRAALTATMRSSGLPLRMASVVSALSTQGGDANDEGETGLLHWAAQCGQLEMAKELLGVGASSNEGPTLSWDDKDSQGRTPMHFAAKHGHYHVVAMLWQRFCDAAQKGDGTRPHRQRSALSVSSLDNPFLAPDKDFRTPLGYAFRSAESAASLKNGDMDMRHVVPNFDVLACMVRGNPSAHTLCGITVQ